MYRVSRLSLIVTRTKCLQLQWQKTSRVKCSLLKLKLENGTKHILCCTVYICIQIRKGKRKDVGSTFPGIKMVVSSPQEFPLTRENVILIRQLFTLLTF